MKKRRPKPTMTPAQALAAMRAQAVSKEALARGDKAMRRFSIVSYGAGTNSTAMLVGLHERGERPDAILFADTGGERPETYRHKDAVSEWCDSIGFPGIETIKKGGLAETLEENCIRMNMLPSLAYGFKGCSHKYKIEPQEKWANNNEECRNAWASGRSVEKLIGFDADENHRAKIPHDNKYMYRYPLVEWGWGRDECVEAIARAGLPQPGKSACFFCPASKPHEILALKAKHPDLLRRALEMERGADLTSIRGLGRGWAWADLIAADEAQLKLFTTPFDAPCGCVDG